MQTKDLLNLLKCRRHALQFRYLSFHLTSHIFQAHTKNAKEGTSIGSKVASEGKGNWTGADTGGSGERASIFVSGWGFGARLLQKKAKKGIETRRAKRASRERLFEFVFIDSKAGGVPASKAKEICEKNEMYLPIQIPVSKARKHVRNMFIWYFKHFNQVHLTRSSSFPRFKDVCPRLLHQRRGLQSKRSKEVLHWQLSKVWKMYAPSLAYCCTLMIFSLRLFTVQSWEMNLRQHSANNPTFLVFTLLCQDEIDNKYVQQLPHAH